MEKFKTTLLILLTVAVIIMGYTSYSKHRKLGYITTAKVFDEFVYKKEMEDELRKIQLVKQTYLDSLKLKIQTLALGLTPAKTERNTEIEEFKKMYLLKEDQFNKEGEAIFQNYNDKIWKQLNQYIEDYGKENKYDYLFGTSGQGNLMYAASGDNITETIIKYVNEKYSGKVK